MSEWEVGDVVRLRFFGEIITAMVIEDRGVRVTGERVIRVETQGATGPDRWETRASNVIGRAPRTGKKKRPIWEPEPYFDAL